MMSEMTTMAAPEGDGRLFITKVPQTITKDDIAAHFGQFGATTDVYVPSIPGNPGHKGIAFVSYADATSLQLALGNGPHQIQGQDVVVDIAAPRGQAPMTQKGAFSAQGKGGGKSDSGGDRLFVTKVPPQLQKEQLQMHFAQFGDISDLYLPTVPGSSNHKGICFVSFSDPSSVQRALQQQPHEVAGHQIVVDIAAPRGFEGGKKGGGKGISYAMATQPSFQQAGFGFPGGFGQADPFGYQAYQGQQMGGGFGFPSGPGGFNPTEGAPAATTGTPVPGRLFLTKVPPDVTTTDLQIYFQQFGQLNDAFIPSGGKGIAFVTFGDTNVATQVLQAQQHFIRPGQAVLVEQALDRPGFGKGGGKGGKSRFGPY